MLRQAASIPAPAASTISGNASQSQSQSPFQSQQQQDQQQGQQYQRQHQRSSLDGRDRGHVDNRHPLRGAQSPAAAGPENWSGHNVAGVVVVEDRRHSLPLNLSPSSSSRPTAIVGDGQTSVEAEHASLPGPNARHEITAAQRAAALRHLKGTSARSRHRQSKSTSARSDTTDHPVVVRTYSGTPPLEHRHRHPPPIQEEPRMARPDIPPVEAFSFDDIMKNVEPDVVGALDAIAGICANYSYSPSDHYDAHMPPQGHLNGAGAAVAHTASTDEGQLRPQQARNRMGAVVHAVPITYHSLDAVMSTNMAPPPGRAAYAHPQDPAYQGAGYGSVDLNEPEFHTLNHNASVPRETCSPIALIDGSARRRSSHAPSASTATATLGPATTGLTASPAPEVLTEVRRASRPSIDHHIGPSSRVHHSHHTHARTQSMFEQFVSWFPWSTDGERLDQEGTYGGSTAEYSSSYSAENRLRGLLAAGHGAP